MKTSFRPRTIQDIEKIQDYIKTSNASNSLEEQMYLENKKNSEFKKFFKKFKEENKDKWESIIDGTEIDLNILKKESIEELEDKYTMLKQFNERKKLNKGIEVFDSIASKKNEDEKQFIPEGTLNRRTIKKPNISKSRTEDPYDSLLPDEDSGELYDSSKLNLIFLSQSMICKITPLNRIYHRKVLLFAGNKEGMISYGWGVGPLYEDAWNNAFVELKKNLLLINWDPENTFPQAINSKYHDFKFNMRPSGKPTWTANPLLINMIRYVGLYHQNFNTISRKKKPVSLLFAMFKLATNNSTKKLISEGKGYKAKHIYNQRGLNTENYRKRFRLRPQIRVAKNI